MHQVLVNQLVDTTTQNDTCMRLQENTVRPIQTDECEYKLHFG